jgi:hypothetical protein
MSGIAEPECPLGYPMTQLEALLNPVGMEAFNHWFNGQTGSICEGKQYNPAIRKDEPDACAGHPHGLVVYASDFRRFLAGMGDAEWPGT